MENQTVYMRRRLSERDVYYGGGLVNGANNVGMMGETISRLLAQEYGNMGRCVNVKKVRLFSPCSAGDYVECHARILKVDGNRIEVESRCYKIGGVPEDPPFESSAEILEEPIIIMAMMATYEVPVQ